MHSGSIFTGKSWNWSASRIGVSEGQSRSSSKSLTARTTSEMDVRPWKGPK
jgi:hypothetical protein